MHRNSASITRPSSVWSSPSRSTSSLSQNSSLSSSGPLLMRLVRFLPTVLPVCCSLRSSRLRGHSLQLHSCWGHHQQGAHREGRQGTRQDWFLSLHEEQVGRQRQAERQDHEGQGHCHWWAQGTCFFSPIHHSRSNSWLLKRATVPLLIWSPTLSRPSTSSVDRWSLWCMRFELVIMD